MSPYTTISRQNAQIVRAFCAEFGLTPGSRTRLSVGDSMEDDDMGGLLD